LQPRPRRDATARQRDAGTLVRWHRDLVRRRSPYPGRRSGRPELATDVRELGLRLARENPRWGDQRIVGELGGLGLRVSATSVRKIPRRAGPGPASGPAGPSWREFLGTRAQTMIACAFSRSTRFGPAGCTRSS
jgi:hypothetical protein